MTRRTDPIASYAAIGDLRTAALCGPSGSIDWMCVPRFDSEPLFGALVDPAGGAFDLAVDGAVPSGRRYRDRSVVLESVLATPGGEVTVTDAMVPDMRGLRPGSLLLRSVAARGPATVRVRVDPRRGLPGRRGTVARRGDAVVWTWGQHAVGLRSAPVLALDAAGRAVVELEDGERLHLTVSVADAQPLVFVDPAWVPAAFDDVDRWWSRECGSIDYDGPSAEAVARSIFTLVLLTFGPSGAPVAAPTTSLPEQPGGGRNWDYRYSWIRDAALGVEVMVRVGLVDRAWAYARWLLHASRLTRPRLCVAYDVFGRGMPPERVVEVDGYDDSRPVRVGNAAGEQHQLDVYGWIVDAATSLDVHGGGLDGATWRTVRGFADFIAERWRDPDHGIWEIRDEPRHHVSSKMLAWMGLDRAVQVAERRGEGGRRVERWRRERDALRADVRERGWNEELGSYVRAYGESVADAAVALLPATGMEPDPARLRSTLAWIRRSLSAGGPLLYRYRGDDGLEGDEGAFLACSFWLVEALALVGDVDGAEALFRDLCARANDVGLYAEEMDPRTGRHLGNFPQALTHASLIRAGLALRDAQPGRRRTASSTP